HQAVVVAALSEEDAVLEAVVTPEHVDALALAVEAEDVAGAQVVEALWKLDEAAVAVQRPSVAREVEAEVGQLVVGLICDEVGAGVALRGGRLAVYEKPHRPLERRREPDLACAAPE